MSTIGRQHIIVLPDRFTFFNRGIVDFEAVLGTFDWELRNQPVVIDMSMCTSANYQALALLVAYIWRLTANNCDVELKYGNVNAGAAQMIHRMGAANWWPVLMDDSRNFKFGEDINRTLYALRRRDEVRIAIDKATAYITRAN